MIPKIICKCQKRRVPKTPRGQNYLTLPYRAIFFLPLCKIIKSMGLEIRKLLFIPLVIIQTGWYNTMPFRFCVSVLESFVLRKSILSRWCWGNFQCRGILQIGIREEEGPIALAVGAGGSCLDIFSHVYHFSFSISLGDGLI